MAATPKAFGRSINLNKNELQNAAIQNLATAPSSPVNGQIYYDTVADKVYVYSTAQGAWVSIMGDITNVLGTAPIFSSVDADGIATISIVASSNSTRGTMSISDFNKLAAATSAATPSTIMMRDSSGRVKGADAVASDDLTTLGQVGTLISQIGALVGDFDASPGLVPTTGNGVGGAIKKGDYWRISVAGVITGLSPEEDLAVGDTLVAKADGATLVSQFFSLQANVSQASETEKGILKISTQPQVATGTDDTTALTPLKYRTDLDLQLANKVKGYNQDSVTVGTSPGAVTITHNLNTTKIAGRAIIHSTLQDYDCEIKSTGVNTATIEANGANVIVDVFIWGI